MLVYDLRHLEPRFLDNARDIGLLTNIFFPSGLYGPYDSRGLFAPCEIALDKRRFRLSRQMYEEFVRSRLELLGSPPFLSEFSPHQGVAKDRRYPLLAEG